MNILTTQSYRLPIALSILFTALLTWVIMHTINNVKTSYNVPQSLLTTSTHRHYIPPVNRWHLFGLYRAQLNNLPKTSLQLTLEGTIVDSSQPQDSRAIVASPNQNAQIYHPGQILPGGAIVNQILPNRIILNNHGQLQSLNIPVPTLNTNQK